MQCARSRPANINSKDVGLKAPMNCFGDIELRQGVHGWQSYSKRKQDDNVQGQRFASDAASFLITKQVPTKSKRELTSITTNIEVRPSAMANRY